MSVAAQYIPAAYSLTAVGVWGASDFLGGVGARRANAFLFTAIVHISGLVVVGTLALMTRAPFPGRASLVWSLIAGSVAGLALALFYRSLASGNMGLVAPVAAVLGAAIPAVVTAFAEGVPGDRHVLGFILAGIGVWLISRTEAGVGRPKGLGMAVLAGIGFAGFYLCIHQAGNASALWVAACSPVRFLAGHGSCRSIRKTSPRGARAGAGHCRGCRNPRHHRHHRLHPRVSNRTPGRCGRAQLALSRCHRSARSHLFARALQPGANCWHGGGAGGGTDDCGVSKFVIPYSGIWNCIVKLL